MKHPAKQRRSEGKDGKRLLSNLQLLFFMCFLQTEKVTSSCVKLCPDFAQISMALAVQDEQSTHLELWAETFLRSRVASELLMPLDPNVLSPHDKTL